MIRRTRKTPTRIRRQLNGVECGSYYSNQY
jgi:hypothetical protein